MITAHEPDRLAYRGRAPAHRQVMSVATLQSSAMRFLFRLDQPLAFVVSWSPAIELRANGTQAQIAALR